MKWHKKWNWKKEEGQHLCRSLFVSCLLFLLSAFVLHNIFPICAGTSPSSRAFSLQDFIAVSKLLWWENWPIYWPHNVNETPSSVGQADKSKVPLCTRKTPQTDWILNWSVLERTVSRQGPFSWCPGAFCHNTNVRRACSQPWFNRFLQSGWEWSTVIRKRKATSRQ